MLGSGFNKANISGIKQDLCGLEIDGLGEGLLFGEQKNEERNEPNFIEALQFTDTKPKRSKTKPSGAAAAGEDEDALQ